MLAIITGLAAEARLAAPLGVSRFVGGGTSAGAARAAAAALAAGATTLISFGVAGGLDPSLPPGTLLIPRQVFWRGAAYQADAALAAALGGYLGEALLAGDQIAASSDDKEALWHQTGAVGIDLESGAVAETARRSGVAFAVLRAICDPAGRDLPRAAIVAIDGSGVIGAGRVAASVMRRPWQIPDLVALALDAARARRALAGRVESLAARRALAQWA